MKKIIRNNSITLLMVLGFVLGISLAMPVHAQYNSGYGYSFMASSGAAVTGDIANGSTNNSNGNTGYNYNNYNNYPANPSPVIYSIDPKFASIGAQAATVTLTGANFIPSSLVIWNGSYMSRNYVDSNHLTVTFTATDLATAENYPITVFNPAPGGGTSNGIYFAVGVPSQTTTTAQSNLAANAVFASNSFMPSNFFQWFLLFIMILLVVILARKLAGNKKAKKDQEPLKHA